jgi:phosphoribosyl-dephospho-CoA transferase
MRPHDLLRLKEGACVIADDAPAWMAASLQRANVVVVRRDALRGDRVPVGVRGHTRDQRFAAHVHASAIDEVITPEALAQSVAWRTTSRRTLPIFRAMEYVARAATDLSLTWGPGGSVGFELATDTPTVSENSDLDLIVRPTADHLAHHLQAFRDAVAVLGPRVDITIEATCGSAALDEWLVSPQRVLIKTMNGPQLGAFAW